MSLFSRIFPVSPRACRLTPRRVANYYNGRLSRRLGLARNPGYPIRLNLEPTNVCNLRCAFCCTGCGSLRRQPRMMSFHEMRTAVDQLMPWLLKVNVAGFGEPTLNPELPEMLTYLKAGGVLLSLNSNLLRLDESLARAILASKLDSIKVSLDAATPETFLKLKQVDAFDQTVERIRLLHRLVQEAGPAAPLLVVQFVISAVNHQEVDSFRQLMTSFGVKHFRIKGLNIVAGAAPGKEQERLATNRHLADSPHNRYRHPPWSQCTWPFDGAMLFADGSLAPCCRDYHGQFAYGNLLADSFNAVWNGPKAVAFRRTFCKAPNRLSICDTCG